MNHFSKYLISVVAIAIVSCDSSNEGQLKSTGKEYFPLRVGQYQLYEVDETKYTLGTPQTFIYELKTIIVDSFPNVEGNYTYVIQRSTRMAGETDFNYLDTWSARIDDRKAILNEENISFLKIKFPIVKGSEWNGNAYNTAGEDLYTMEDTKSSYSSPSETFTDCIVVNQNDNEDYIVFLDQRKEIYANGIGLVYKESNLLRYCSVGSCLGQQKVESGVKYKQTIKAYGVE